MSGSTGTATNASTCAPEAPRCALRGRVGHRATSRKRGVNGRKLCRFYRFLVVSSRSSADQSESAKHSPCKSGLPARICVSISAISWRQRAIHAATFRSWAISAKVRPSPSSVAVFPV